MKEPVHRQIVYVPEEFFLEVFTGQLRSAMFLYLPVQNTVPKDAKICGVYHRFEKRAFAFVVEHPSFPPVFEGCEYPILKIQWDVVKVKHEKPVSQLEPAKAK